MSMDGSISPLEKGCWRWRTLTGLLILTLVGLRVAYLVFNCPLNLASDEAHYWDWSRHLDWSYYSKGPLVAWLIKAGCVLVGENSLLAVRLPAIICGSLLLVSLYILTRQVYGNERLAFVVVACALTLPMVAAGSMIMTIDAPYTCCWGWALVLGHRAIFRGSWWAWPLTGLVIGLGILAKYTMVLWIPSVMLFLLATPGYRHLLFRFGLWIMNGVAAVCCLPILVWNMQHEWVTFLHVGGQAGIRDSQGIIWLGPLTYVSTQFGLLLGFWFVAWSAAMVADRPWKELGWWGWVVRWWKSESETDRGDSTNTAATSYLWWMSASMFMVFFLFSFKTAEEPNWPVTTYISGLVLAVGWIARQLQSSWPALRRVTAASLATACVLGLLVITFMHQSIWMQPVLLRISGPVTDKRPAPLRRFDPTCRLRGWHSLAADVDRVRDELRAKEGIEPLIAGYNWSLPGELGFYCTDHPTVYSLGPAVGDRHSQYDYWRPNPVRDADEFKGRTFIFVGDIRQELCEGFEQVEPGHTVVYSERGQPIAQWHVTICRGFRGFPKLPGGTHF